MLYNKKLEMPPKKLFFDLENKIFYIFAQKHKRKI